MKVVWAPTAVDRAHEEAEFIAQDKPDAALRWLNDLFAATDRLQTFPQSGSVVPESARAITAKSIFDRIVSSTESTLSVS